MTYPARNSELFSPTLKAGVPEKEARRLATDTPEDPHLTCLTGVIPKAPKS